MYNSVFENTTNNVSSEEKLQLLWGFRSSFRFGVSYVTGALFNTPSLWVSSVSYKVNTINYLKLNTQRTVSLCKSGIFSVARDRNYLSYLQGLVGFGFFFFRYNLPRAVED